MQWISKGDEIMTAGEVVKFLNEDATDEQFAEVFALLEIAMIGRGLPMIYDTEDIILNMDIDCICNKVKIILKEIQENVENNVLDRVLGK